jgi:predicted permease
MKEHYLTPFATCLAWKLGLAPLMIYAIGMSLHISAPIFSITLLQAAMAPMVTAAILAEQGELNPPLANMMVGLGILLSFITVPLWNLIV